MVDELTEYKIERARRKRYIQDLDSRLGRSGLPPNGDFPASAPLLDPIQPRHIPFTS